MDGAPVTHNEAIEAEDVAQVVVQRFVVGTGINLVDPIVTAHDGADVGTDGRLKRWIVHFHEGALVNVRAAAHAVDFLVIVDIMLEIRHHATRLDALDQCGRQFGAECWIFTGKVLKVAPIIADPHDVHARAKLHAGAFSTELAAHELAPAGQEG